MVRRTVLCSLDAGVERPELREFAFDPIARVLENRGAYVAAAITISRAYRAAGLPTDSPPPNAVGFSWRCSLLVTLLSASQSSHLLGHDSSRMPMSVWSYLYYNVLTA